MKMFPFFTRNRFPSAALGIALLLSGWSATTSAQIVANFDAGNTSTAVDGNPGMAGEGWAGPWGNPNPGSGRTLTRTVVNTDPLKVGSGNYLSVTMTNSTVSATARRTELVRRTYEDEGLVSLNAPHTISFLYRINQPVGGATPGIFDSARNASEGNETSAFYLRVSGSEWGYYTAPGSWVGTEVPMIFGDTYAFTIQLDPVTKLWGFSVINLDDADFSFSIDSLGFFGSDFYGETARDAVGGQLQWSMTLTDRPDGEAPIHSVTYDLDSILIIPEPGVTALLLGAGTLWLTGRLVCRRKNDV
ncbi:MAG TPA: hypothetical protein VNQ90_03125 [Chthoniobacteraceae bacterium]|nr:hypothetical protein [Chthoniobacteraceae bacterium]